MWQEADFSGIYHRISKDRNRGHPPISPDPKEWPEEWKTIRYKTYPRLPKVDLPDGRVAADFSSLVFARRSRREYSGKALSREEVAALFRYSCSITSGHEDKVRCRAQPSGGALYPIEAYIVVLVPGEIPAGIYHYDVAGHRLDVLEERTFDAAEIKRLFTFDWVRDAAAVVVLTGVFERGRAKYGDRGYRYALLEAGHIGQGVHLAAEAFGLGCCAIGGTDDIALERLFDIDGINESVVYGIVIGKR